MSRSQIAEIVPHLGAKAKDVVSGFTGTITGCSLYLNGCTRVCIDGIDKDGLPKGYWFDWSQVEVLKAKATKMPVHDAGGGPRPAPMRREDPE